MDVPRDSQLDPTVLGLAEQAREALLNLYLRLAGTPGQAGITSPVEVCQVLGSLSSMVDNLVRSLPELGGWLEQQLLAGSLPCAEADFDTLTRTMHDATSALSHARGVASQLGRDLARARTASQGLVSP
ncbi:MAG: hypothetical protein ACJ72N_09440 [Labedaea sp.]